MIVREENREQKERKKEQHTEHNDNVNVLPSIDANTFLLEAKIGFLAV